ncbi:MAG: DNA polymerase III subunit delta [Bacilli bacterium]|nr:DNA polymerase III subunit delta [Bacilli bacterium]
MNNYLIEYNDIYLLNNKIDELINKEFKEASKSVYDLEEETLDNALNDLDTYSFLTERKIIIIKNINKLEDDKFTKHLMKYLDNPNNDNLLILTTNKLNMTKKINKELKNKTNYLKLEANLEKEIKTMLKGYKIDTNCINMLIEYSNNNIDIIKTECDKLINYKESDKNITKDDIEKIVVKHLGDSNNLVFDLVKYIASKDKRRALEKYEKLKEYSIDDIALTGLLESQLRLMVQVNMLMKRRYSKDEIAKTLSQHPYRIQKTMELVRTITNKELTKLIQNLSEMDYKIKSGKIAPKDQMLMYIINL